MFAGLLDEFSGKIRLTLTSLLWGGIAAAAATAAVLFLSVGGFLWVQTRFDAVTACLVLGAAYLLVALTALAVVMSVRRRRPKVAPPTAPSPWWSDPVAIMTALQLVKAVGITRLLPIAVLGAVAAGLVLERAPKREPAE
jgi:hypothetical protein